MTQHERQGAGVLAAKDVPIGAAEAAGQDVNEDVSLWRLGSRALHDLDMSDRGNHERPHVTTVRASASRTTGICRRGSAPIRRYPLDHDGCERRSCGLNVTRYPVLGG